MNIHALKYVTDSTEGGFIRYTLEPGMAVDYREEGVSVVFLIKVQDISHFRRMYAPVINRGIKNKHKGLSEYLLGQGRDKVLVINGNYATSVQLERSIRAFYYRAKENSENNINIIGTEEAIFDELWGRAEKKPEPKDREIEDESYEGIDSNPDPENTQTWLLLQLKERHEEPPELKNKYIGRSIKAQLVRQMIMRAANSEEPVLILGDTGTGKELVAWEIHKHRTEGGPEFKPVNCGAIPRELFESELFGYAKGSFTDAKTDKMGQWEAAGNGTLFLDEIGDLHPMHQVKILRVLETKQITRIGETKERNVFARVIAATNRDLFSMVKSKNFREDLYYRLRGLVINLPTLREHPTDIPLLAQHFWKDIAKDPKKTLPQEIMKELQSHSWPGNSRELRMVLNNLRALFGTEGLGIRHLQSVFYLDGHNEMMKGEVGSENEVSLHRAMCLRHLKYTDEVVRASSVTLMPIIENNDPDAKSVVSVRESLSYRLNELEMLTLKPLLFHSEVSFSAVYGLKGKLAYFQNLLKDDSKSAQNFWKQELENEFKSVLSIVFKEIERVLRND